MGLGKRHSWSPDSDREEAWVRRQTAHRGRRAGARSFTDEDLDELRGCIDLGFGFDDDDFSTVSDAARRLSETLPALDLYYAVQRSYRGSAAGSPLSESPSSSSSSPGSFFAPGDNPEERKARLKLWAQVVACTVRQRR